MRAPFLLGVLIAIGLGGCGGAPARSARAAPSAVVWDYDVRATPGLDLEVAATFRSGVSGELRVDPDAAPFVDRVEVETNGRFSPAKREAISCPAPCKLRYRVRLRDAATALEDVDTALLAGGAVLAPPSTWLLHPAAVPASGRYRFHVVAPPGSRFVTGVRPATDGQADTYEADVAALEEASFAGFGAFRVHRLASPAIDLALAPALELPDDVAVAWARAEVVAMTAYLGRAPDDRALLFFVPGTQPETRGKTLGDGGAAVLVRVGTAVTSANALDDWVVAHELVHVGSPNLDNDYNWFAEGLATYVEPIARARAGLIAPEKVWGDLVEGLPKGLPKPGQGGLDGTTEIDRVYWGGALYFLLADVAIRERTGGARSLDDAVKAWRMEGGTIEAHWSLARTLDVGDTATGTRVLHELYERLGRAPGTEDLTALWSRLGVTRTNKTVSFDDRAPLAPVRSAISSRRPR